MTALSSVRRVKSEADWDVVYHGLGRLVTEAINRPTKAIHKIVDHCAAYTSLRHGGYEVWLVDGYLVVFALGTPWYSTSPVISELLIVRVRPGGTLTGVAQFLKDQARSARAAIVAVGTAFARSDRALTRLYQSEGFQPEGTTLTWEP